MDEGDQMMTGLVLLLLAVIGWQYWTEAQRLARRGGAGRRRPVAASAVEVLPLDPNLGQLTPDHLVAHYGPMIRPPHWTRHRVCYPPVPGQELERLIHGAPGSVNQTTPAAQRVWMFAPPSEVDI